jgi:hypothetical protein
MIHAVVFLVAVGMLSPGQQPGVPAAGKSGTVRIVADPGFGAGTEWDTLFGTSSMGPAPPTVKWTAFLPDGSFFRAAAADGLVHKFDALGNLIKTFGHKGQGPGDLQNPAALDVLDAKILVVNDAGNRRLSLFDLDGGFLRTVRLQGGGISSSSILTLTALAGDKIACAVYEGRTSPPDVIAARYRVLIKDLADEQETELAAFDWEKPRSKFMVRVMEWEPAVFLAKAGPDRVLVACSSTPEIAIFSFSGEKLSSFTLDVERTKITWKHLEFAVHADENPKNIEFMARNKSDIKLPEYLPLFSRLALDPQDRVLVYDFNAARFSREASFKAFTLDGRLLASVKLDTAGYEPVMPVHFWKDFAYADLVKAGGEGSFAFARFKFAAD